MHFDKMMGANRLLAFFHRYRMWIYGAILLVAVGVMLFGPDRERFIVARSKLDYAQSLDRKLASVNDEALTLRDLAFYIAYEEAQVQEQANDYDPENVKKYWDIHMDGIFIRVAARNAALEMAIHDKIFYQMAQEEGIELDDEEEVALLRTQDDFWSDLSERDGVAGLGITRQELDEQIRRAAVAQKYQSLYAAFEEQDAAAYHFDGERYAAIRKQQKIKIDDELLRQIDMGNITL